MSQYPEEFKASIIARMLPPNNVSVPELARETGIPKDTLYTWRLKHRKANGDAKAKQVPSGGLRLGISKLFRKQPTHSS